MLSTYQAVLPGEVLERPGDKPQNPPPERGAPVYVTILEEETLPTAITARGLRMAAALEQLAWATRMSCRTSRLLIYKPAVVDGKRNKQHEMTLWYTVN